MDKKDYKALQAKIIKGFSLLTAREIFGKVIAIFGQIILIRLLAPEYFGLFAILLFIIGVAELFTDVGFTYAVIQKKDEPSNEDLSSIFFVKQALSLIIILLIYFLSSFILATYRNLHMEQMIMLYALSAVLVIKSYKNILVALLERSMRYDVISKIELSGMAIYYLSVSFFAFIGLGVWSFIIGLIIKEILELTISFYNKKWFPIFALNVKSIKDFIKFGIYLQFGAILGFVHRSTIPVIAGVNTTAFEVGLLDWSQNVASIPRSFIENYGRVAFSSFSKIQAHRQALILFIEQSLSVLGLITVFIIIYMIGSGSKLVEFIFTEKWIPALPSLYWFIGSIFFISGTSVLGQAIIALGKTKEILIMSLVVILTEWILAYTLLLKFGFVGISAASFFGSILLFLSYVFYLLKINLKINYIKIYIPILVIFLISGLLIKSINFLIPDNFLFFILKSFLISITYVVLVNIFEKKYLKQMLLIIRSNIFHK